MAGQPHSTTGRAGGESALTSSVPDPQAFDRAMNDVEIDLANLESGIRTLDGMWSELQGALDTIPAWAQHELNFAIRGLELLAERLDQRWQTAWQARPREISA